MITRRRALVSLLFAPAVIRTPGLLMPVKRMTSNSVSFGWNGFDGEIGDEELKRAILGYGEPQRATRQAILPRIYAQHYDWADPFAHRFVASYPS